MKNQLGQFFTTNSDYILQGLEPFVRGKCISDPFAGNQDLIKWAQKNDCKKISGFDYDRKYVDGKKIKYNDSINNPKIYKFVLTNPPYLHKNKADNIIKEKFFSGRNAFFEDLYQVSILSAIDCEEGIFIVPLNFLSAENSQRIRNIFFDKFEIVKLNIFTQQVFEDTTYNVVSFYFIKKEGKREKNKFSATIFPKGENIDFIIEKRFGWQMGGNFLNEVKKATNRLRVSRLTEESLRSGDQSVPLAFQNIKYTQNIRIDKGLKLTLEKNILLLRAIDSKNGKKIQLEDIRNYGIYGLVGKNTSRNMAHIIFGENISIEEQEDIMTRFNRELKENRDKYFSFFLTNFRDNGRKRISFDFVYKLINHIYEQKHQRQQILL
ncbi:MAG: hypothetical protein COX31_03485 [Candidatus Moranbacteria bacterium CG23_combo_of_CG06-09_8_20_14_all_40_16]|nr:MAG: hypothetical protein COX31_03485 [Candidatus Moranbacteria bacterium CG23_combo_of_CG06-09_8_20_14_all_40_16]